MYYCHPTLQENKGIGRESTMILKNGVEIVDLEYNPRNFIVVKRAFDYLVIDTTFEIPTTFTVPHTTETFPIHKEFFSR
jgi:hypothetical protein